MVRPQTYNSALLAEDILNLFWKAGYYATSMDDLVKHTSVSRHGLYKEFGSKKGAILAAFDLYQTKIVTPAFAQVEHKNGTLDDVATYFEHQISLAEETGLPGPGCFVANSATEIAQHDQDIRQKIEDHNNRLRAGFTNAIYNSTSKVDGIWVEDLAEIMLIFTNGIWNLSRSVKDAKQLRNAVEHFLNMVERELS